MELLATPRAKEWKKKERKKKDAFLVSRFRQVFDEKRSQVRGNALGDGRDAHEVADEIRDDGGAELVDVRHSTRRTAERLHHVATAQHLTSLHSFLLGQFLVLHRLIRNREHIAAQTNKRNLDSSPHLSPQLQLHTENVATSEEIFETAASGYQ